MSDGRQQRVLMLNGPSGVGKPTIARLLAGTVANGACIHGDALAAITANLGSLGYVVDNCGDPRAVAERSTTSRLPASPAGIYERLCIQVCAGERFG